MEKVIVKPAVFRDLLSKELVSYEIVCKDFYSFQYMQRFMDKINEFYWGIEQTQLRYQN